MLFAQVIEHAVEVSQPFIDKRKQQLTVELQPESALIDGDAVRLAQVFSNLLINASKFTQDEGRIKLMAEMRSDDSITVLVKDNGIGIAPHIRPHIFDLFMQGSRSLARTEGGLGIGLTVARSIVEMHGGSITVTSDGAGLGSEFSVTLPVHGVAEQSIAGPTVTAKPGGHCRVLIIEDNVDASAMVQMLLELDGHSVSLASNGIDGLSMAMTNAHEVIVCDIGLPGMDGLEFVRNLRRQSSEPMPLMIATSGYGQPADRARALEAGFNAYLVKPIESDQLLRLIASQAQAG